jgi:hypothetical protein
VWVDETFTFHDDETVTAQGNLNLDTLTDARMFPNNLTTVGGALWLRGLTSAEHLTLPTTVGGGLDLNGLTSAEHLTLPTTVRGYLWVRSLPDSEKDRLRKERPDLKIT